MKSDLDQVKTLIKQGAPVNATGDRQVTPLMLAAMRNLEITRFLLAHDADARATDADGNSALIDASYFQKTEIVRALLEAGADPNLANHAGDTALIDAARMGNDSLSKMLLDHHAQVNTRTKKLPALWWAVTRDHLGTARLLLDAGADPSLISTDPTDPQKMGPNMLCWAVSNNDLEMIDLLLDHKVDINAPKDDGMTPLLVAACGARSSTIDHLFQCEADPNLACEKDGITPFIFAAENEDVPTMDLFLQHGAHIDARDHEGRTALIHAAAIGALAQVQELVARKADVNAVDNNGETALTWAGNRASRQIVGLLKKAGATRTDLHIIAATAADPPLSKSHLWAMAVGAVYAQLNGSNHASLSRNWFESNSKNMLDRQWEIHDRAALLHVIGLLERGPTRSEFLAEQAHDCLSYPGYEPKLVRGFQLMFLDLWWRERTDVAWNLCRAANLVRMGVQVGYLQESEAWPLYMSIAHKTQDSFSSWHEMSDNFLDGREIDSNKRSGDLRACTRLLVNPNDPNSPWNQLPWKTDLDQ